MRQILEHVEARDALFGQQHGGPGLRLLQDGGKQVADLRLLPLRALDVEDGGLQRPAEGRRLLGLALLAARERLDRRIQAVADLLAQHVQIGAAGAENALAIRIVCKREEQVLEREIGVAA